MDVQAYRQPCLDFLTFFVQLSFSRLNNEIELILVETKGLKTHG